MESLGKHEAQSGSEPMSLRIITFNIKTAPPPDGPLKFNEEPWSKRAPLVVSQLEQLVALASSEHLAAGEHGEGSAKTAIRGVGKEEKPVVIALQEACWNQVLDVQRGLNHVPKGKKTEDQGHEEGEWMFHGVGRDDGGRKGEFVPIFYRRRQLRVVGTQTRWLSDTPTKPSRGKGARCKRIVEMIVFENLEEEKGDNHGSNGEGKRGKGGKGKRFLMANTHLDHGGSEPRVESVGVLLESLKQMQAHYQPDLPIMLSGDFNSPPISAVGEPDAYSAILESGLFSDTFAMTAKGHRQGPEATFSGFNPRREAEKAARIDFVWVGGGTGDSAGDGGQLPSGPWSVQRYLTLPNVIEKVYSSDHRAVCVDLQSKA